VVQFADRSEAGPSLPQHRPDVSLTSRPRPEILRARGHPSPDSPSLPLSMPERSATTRDTASVPRPPSAPVRASCEQNDAPPPLSPARNPRPDAAPRAPGTGLYVAAGGWAYLGEWRCGQQHGLGVEARFPTSPAPAAGAVGAARRASGRPASPQSGEARPRDLSAASLHPGERWAVAPVSHPPPHPCRALPAGGRARGRAGCPMSFWFTRELSLDAPSPPQLSLATLTTKSSCPSVDSRGVRARA